ncbi:MAG: nitric oxide reductase transcriptional regulator NorR [Rubrivivax sp.]|jgi:anaerobic nitric oxide reductase transcription regulator|nr:nitric oxide reductase transcriptional regulator NorR [Rubrivivax sp.]
MVISTLIEGPLLTLLLAPQPAAERLQQLAAAVQAGFGCDAVALLALEPDNQTPALRPLATAGLVRDALGRRFGLAEQPRLAAIMAASGPVAFEHDSRLPDPYDGLIAAREGQPLPVHDCMGVRLQQEGRPWGALTLDGLRPGRFDAAARAALARVAREVELAVRVTRLERENQALRQGRVRLAREHEDAPALAVAADDDLEIVAHGQALRALLHESRIVAESDLPVLLLGETGVGKELFARRLHRLSRRHARPLVQVNCAALPESLAESELFGHARGAFSGAGSERAGRVEAAQGGTLFLDEVGELPLALQAKLLRTLQNGEIQRLGSDRPRKVDVRVIAATNRDLRAAVRDGRFRADLYHRLSVYPLPIPPLRERRDDLLPLAGRFLELNRARLGLRSLRLAPAAEQALLAYDWPGNVRELEHVIGRAALRAAGALDDRHHIVTLQAADLGLEPPARTAEPLAAAAAAASSAPTLKAATDAAQRACIEHGLAGHGGNWAAAARALGVDASNLHKLARRLGLK